MPGSQVKARKARERDAYTGWRVADCARTLQADIDDETRYRLLMHGLPRRFHGLDRRAREKALQVPAPLTGTRWDALLAALTEHVAELHGHEVPDWVDEPERFLRHTWVISPSPHIARHSVLFAPAAFIRHRVYPDPRDLDFRGGEKHAWVLGVGGVVLSQDESHVIWVNPDGNRVRLKPRI